MIIQFTTGQGRSVHAFDDRHAPAAAKMRVPEQALAIREPRPDEGRIATPAATRPLHAATSRLERATRPRRATAVGPGKAV